MAEDQLDLSSDRPREVTPFGISVLLHVRPVTRPSGAAASTLFCYLLQPVDLENAPHLRSKHGSEVERFRQ